MTTSRGQVSGLWASAIMLLLVFLSGCSREPDHVASLHVSPPSLLVRHGQCAPLRLQWSPTAVLDRREGSPVVFVHLLYGPHNLVRTFDHPLPFSWQEGSARSYVIDICQSSLAPPLPAGMYNLKIGLYDDAIGYRWPLQTNGEEMRARAYRVARVVVPDDSAEGPAFAFAGDWPKVETLKDKQVLTHRRIPSTGRVVIRNIPGPGAIRIITRAMGSTPAPLSIAASCVTGARAVRGIGTEITEIAVNGSPTAGLCAIQFALTRPDGTVYLDSIAWKPGRRSS